MASCATFATQTLYATSVNTVVQDGDPILVTITEGDTVATITSFNPVTQSFTSVQATATLFATRCPSNTRTSAPAATSTSTSAATTTYERSSTNAGGNVVVQTIVETIQRNGTVIQTQTSAPPPSATLVDNTAKTATETKQHTGAIAGGIVGGVLALLAILLCLWFVRKRRRNALHSRNLDDFFNDPTAAGWQDKPAAAAAGAGVAAKRTGTLRSMRSQSVVVLDLEKERDSSATRNGDGHWAAMEPVEDHEDVVTTTRPQSRQSLNTLGRPMSFHSMSIGHGLDAVAAEDPMDAILLRNDSDRSSKSNVTRDEMANGPRSPRSPDLVPAYYGYSSSPPPISPTSSPPPLSPYGSPLPLQDSTLYEGWSAESEARNRAAVQRYNSVSGSLRAGRSSFGSGVALLNNTTAKPRTWSNGALQQADVVQRPRSAQGLANGLNNVGSGDNTIAYNAGFAARVLQYHSMQSPSPPRSPSMSATNTNGALRGRASLSGVTGAHYPHAAYGTSSRSPPPSSAFASSPTSAFPPLQYAHLDVHKTEEEREEDLNTALPASAIPFNTAAADVQSKTRARMQRRHQSLSNDILLRVVNPSLDPSQQQQQQQQERSNDVTRTLSIRNAD